MADVPISILRNTTQPHTATQYSTSNNEATAPSQEIGAGGGRGNYRLVQGDVPLQYIRNHHNPTAEAGAMGSSRPEAPADMIEHNLNENTAEAMDSSSSNGAVTAPAVSAQQPQDKVNSQWDSYN